VNGAGGRTAGLGGDARALRIEQAEQLLACVARGGVAVFPSDTVYGVCCDPDSERAVRRLYELKGRDATRAAAVMFFSLERALLALPELEPVERTALTALLPGPVTLLLRNPRRRYLPACGSDAATLGLRVPRLPQRLRALEEVRVPVMQSSANISGQADARRLAQVPERLRDGADLVIDGGELPGTSSTVIDLRAYAGSGRFTVLREGAIARAEVARLLAGA
jgi:L-threonylcarbamoyladenylate synthase